MHIKNAYIMSSYVYDDQNVFAKILRGELSANVVYEDSFVLAFPTIKPESRIHILIIPKKPYVNYSHFVEGASKEEFADFFTSIEMVAKKLEISNNYKLYTNCGKGAGQEVFHFHMHMISK